MKIIDTHAHLNDEAYDEDLTVLLDRAKERGLSKIILAAADEKSSIEEMRITKQYTSPELELFCTVGVHPHDAVSYTDELHEKLRSWLKNRTENRIVALGEIGLDYHYDNSPREIQKQVFRRQLDLAWEEDIPIILHERDAAFDSLTILEDYWKRKALRECPGVCHCFTGSEETAQRLLNMGFYLGFDGPLTFKNSRKSPDVVKMAPLSRLLIETDSPYLTPVPFRGKRNEPAYVYYVLEKMASLKEVSVEKMAEITMENACRLFGI